jgi:hypothetical protein
MSRPRLPGLSQRSSRDTGPARCPLTQSAARSGWNESRPLGPDACPSAPQPQPALDSPVYKEQSETGYVCWTITTNDAGTLDLYYGTGGPHPGGTIWFALH